MPSRDRESLCYTFYTCPSNCYSCIISSINIFDFRRECGAKVNTVLHELGWASAKAQGLQKPITSGEKLRNSEHILYLLTDPAGFE